MSIKYGKLTIAAAATALLLGSALFFTPTQGVRAAEPPAKPATATPVIKDPKGDPIVATVSGEDVKRSEVIGFINNLPDQYKQLPMDQLFPLARDQVINNKLISKKADSANLEKDPDVVKALAQAKESIIRNVYLERQVEAQVTNKKLADAYKQLLDKVSNIQEVHARHILFAADDKGKTQAEEAIKKLNGGAKWEDVAKEYASGPGGQNGGDLDYFAKDEMVPEFADAAFALDTGKYTKEPVKTRFGWHVIQVLDKRKKPEPEFDQVKPQLEAQLRQETLQTMVEEWAKDAKITRLDINGEAEKNADKDKGKRG